MSNYFQTLIVHVRNIYIYEGAERGSQSLPPHTERTAHYGAELKHKMSYLELSSKNVICIFDL